MPADDPSEDPHRLLSKTEAAHRLHMSVRTLERAMAAGDIRAVRYGTSVRFDPADIKAFIEAQKD